MVQSGALVPTRNSSTDSRTALIANLKLFFRFAGF